MTRAGCLKIESVPRAAQRATLLRLLDRPGHAYRDLKRFFALRYRRCRRRDPLDVPAIGHRTGSAFLRNAKRFAEPNAGSFGVDLGLAACIGERLFASAVEQFRGVRHRKTDAADIVSAGTNERVDHAGELVDVAKAHRHAIAGAIADDGRGCGAVGRVLRLQRQSRSLVVALGDAGALQREQYLCHRRVVGFRCLSRGFGLRCDACIDLRQIRRDRYGSLAADGNRGRRCRLGQPRASKQHCAEHCAEATVTLDKPHFSGTYTLMTSLSSAVFSGSVMYSSMKVSLASSFLSSRWLVMAS